MVPGHPQLVAGRHSQTPAAMSKLPLEQLRTHGCLPVRGQQYAAFVGEPLQLRQIAFHGGLQQHTHRQRDLFSQNVPPRAGYVG